MSEQFMKLSELDNTHDCILSIDRIAGDLVISAPTEGREIRVPLAAARNAYGDELENDLQSNGPPSAAVDPYLAMLDQWQGIAAKASRFKGMEADLRRKLFSGAFPNPKEGTNKHTLPDGRTLVGKHVITRKVDEAALTTILPAMKEAGVANWDRLVRYKPELAKREWDTLSDDLKVQFSPALIATPGMPAFEIQAAKATAS